MKGAEGSQEQVYCQVRLRRPLAALKGMLWIPGSKFGRDKNSLGVYIRDIQD